MGCETLRRPNPGDDPTNWEGQIPGDGPTHEYGQIYGGRQIYETTTDRVIPKLVLSTGTEVTSENYVDVFDTGHSGKVMEGIFASLLLERGLRVWVGVIIDPETNATADFYVWNPQAKRGKLVEITLLKYENGQYFGCSIKTKRRKARQHSGLDSCGLPYVILHREMLMKIRASALCDLF